jgi:hypothetical protein
VLDAEQNTEKLVKMHDQEILRRLGKLIGRRCRYLGQDCMVIDLLTAEAALVLRCEEQLPPVQGDQFGQPMRRAAETCLVPILDAQGDGLAPELLDLLAALEARAA